ncbi:hypothetical protein [Rhodoferax sp.]|uniref:hypothetical protein n=1 Tax=Rhodoferax sp. TaxID=50421 RepID=UPI0028461F27|nr:hypothetical protein [Rhodoferax sp.]MDR3368990.1 hypothetical protein [Rhodoferax sp.]
MSSQPSACERLAQSRESLHQAMQQISRNLEDADGTEADSLLSDILSAWWRKQPLRVALPLAMETAKVLVQPVARRHPYTLVLGAAAVGGLLVLVRPWRWISVPALTAGLLPQIMSIAKQRLQPRSHVASARDRHDSRL